LQLRLHPGFRHIRRLLHRDPDKDPLLAAPANPTPGSRRSVRRILGDDGEEWIVEERPLPYDRRRGTCLVFQRVGLARRVRDFPSNWLALSDAELYRLSLGD
jgi:hypothetical protein